MSYTEINNLYYGPASQAYIKKHGLACPFNPLWVDYKLLMAILFGSKSSSGGLLCTVENDEIDYNYTKGGRDKLGKYAKFIDESCLVTVDNKQYVCFIQVIHAAYAANNVYETRELAKLPYHNVLQNSLKYFGEQAVTSYGLGLQNDNLLCLENDTKTDDQILPLFEWMPIYGAIESSKDTEVLYVLSCINKGKEVVKFGYSGNFHDRMAQYRCKYTNVIVHNMLLVHSNGRAAELQLLQLVKQKHQPCFGNEWFEIPIIDGEKMFIEFREIYEEKVKCDKERLEREVVKYAILCDDTYTPEQRQIWREIFPCEWIQHELVDYRNMFVFVPSCKDKIIGPLIKKLNLEVKYTVIELPIRAHNMKNNLSCIVQYARRGGYYIHKYNDIILCDSRAEGYFREFDSDTFDNVEYYDEHDNLVTDHRK